MFIVLCDVCFCYEHYTVSGVFIMFVFYENVFLNKKTSWITYILLAFSELKTQKYVQ